MSDPAAALPAETARELSALARSGAVSPSEIVEACLARIAAVDPAIHAFVEVLGDGARERARWLESERASGRPLGPLFGVPVGIKDNIAVDGWRLGCASRLLEGHRSVFSATAVARLVAAGAILIGRTNMDEFAFGSSTEHSVHGPTHNPWDAARIPGGSSGGSAAAVAARMLPLALGSDTGGSVRQPAAYCGVTGFKPTFGRISRFGLVAFGSSLDQIGPLAYDAEDCALAMSVLGGHDPRDATSLPEPFSFELADGILQGLRVGIVRPDPTKQATTGIHAQVLARVQDAYRKLAAAGAELCEVALPCLRHAIATYYIVATAEASSNLARFDGIRFGARAAAATLDELYERTRGMGFGFEAKRRILLGTFCLEAGAIDKLYTHALQVRTRMRRELAATFESVDVLVGPTAPIPPFGIGETIDDPLTLWLSDVLTTPANLTGVPAISIPCGFDDAGMPVGLQIHGPALADARVLQIAAAFQRITEFHRQVPQLRATKP